MNIMKMYLFWSMAFLAFTYGFGELAVCGRNNECRSQNGLELVCELGVESEHSVIWVDRINITQFQVRRIWHMTAAQAVGEGEGSVDSLWMGEGTPSLDVADAGATVKCEAKESGANGAPQRYNVSDSFDGVQIAESSVDEFFPNNASSLLDIAFPFATLSSSFCSGPTKIIRMTGAPWFCCKL